MTRQPVIRIEGLLTQFGSNVIHKDLALEVRRGEILGLVGGSGSGKSVLLNTIIGVRRPNAGRVGVLGHRVDQAARRMLSILSGRWGVQFRGGVSVERLPL